MSKRAATSTQNEETRYACRKCPGLTFTLEESAGHRWMHVEQNRYNVMLSTSRVTRSRPVDNNNDLFSRVEDAQVGVENTDKCPSNSSTDTGANSIVSVGFKRTRVASTKRYDSGVVHTRGTGA